MKKKEACDVNPVPLCVDLDGTLVNTDTLVEGIAAVMRNWRALLLLPYWLIKGKARLKAKLAQHSNSNPMLLPYNKSVIQFINENKEIGRYLVLVTAANKSVAEAVNQHLGLFNEVIASDDTRNLRGKEKARALVGRFGNRQFSYIGNDKTDLHIWRVAQSGILVNAPKNVERLAAELTTIDKVLSDRPDRSKALFTALRPYQSVKNLLVFVPVITSNAISDYGAWFNAGLAFMALCFTAFGTYLINDLFDLEADRQHPRKRDRPFASGALPLVAGFFLSPMLILVGIALGIACDVLLIVLCYAVFSIIYSVKLKEKPLVDIFLLALLYTIRLFAGGEATGYHVSMWLLAFSSFLFLSLAIKKRVIELKKISISNSGRAVRRGYLADDWKVLQSMGISSSFVSSLVLALYVQSGVAARAYVHPQVLWGIVPLMLFWQCRLWLSTTRGYVHDDPIIYTAKDWVSWLVGLSLVAVLLVANAKF